MGHDLLLGLLLVSRGCSPLAALSLWRLRLVKYLKLEILFCNEVIHSNIVDIKGTQLSVHIALQSNLALRAAYYYGQDFKSW